MAGLFSRLKNWANGETVTNEDLNAEFDNILDNLTTAYVDDYSASVSQMQTTTDPGEVGTESQATTLAGEIERLRHMLKEITGEDEWYESPISSLLGLSNAIGSGLTNNRLVSGRVISGTQQPQFLTPNGAAATVNLEGATTNFIYYVDGVEYTISTDITLTELTAAPSSNNTCLINDTNAADDDYTKYTGENGTEIPVDNMGSEISSLVGQWAAFSLAGTATEYLFAYVESSTRLSKARRGFFFDSSDAAVPRAAYTNNDTLTLLKLAWIFAKTDGTLTLTYTNPTWEDDEPSSPSIGDYWFDISANTWKVRGASSWSTAGAILVGVCAQDTTNCIAARSFEFFKNYDDLNSCELVYSSATEVQAREHNSQVNVWGTVIKNDWNKHIWDITADRDTGVSESASTRYYCYLTETGDTLISDIRPYDRRGDLKGFYHPHKSWRCVGSFFNNGSSDIDPDLVNTFFSGTGAKEIEDVAAATLIEVRPKIIRLSGSSHAPRLPKADLMRGNEYIFIHSGTSLSQVYTLTADGSETFNTNGNTTFLFHTAGQTLKFTADDTGIIVLSHYAKTELVSLGATTIEGVTLNPTKGDNPTTDRLLWSRDGEFLRGKFEYQNSTATGSGAGTGDYLFTIVPGSTTVDTTRVTAYGGASIGASNWAAVNTVGYGNYSISTTSVLAHAMLYDTTRVRLFGVNSASGGAASSGFGALNNASSAYAFDFVVPITGWEA